MEKLATLDNLSTFLRAQSTLLSFSDVPIIVAGVGLALHQVARRWEPNTPGQMFALAFMPPLVLAPLLYSVHSSFSPYLALVLTFAVYASSMMTSIVAYRISPWHPLSEFPGPLLARVSKLWMLWYTLDGKQHFFLRSLHDKYGDYVRVGPNEVSIRNADAIVPVLGATGLPKGPVWDGRNPGVPNQADRSLTGLRDWAMHTERRKQWNKGFNSAALKGYEQIIVRRGKQLVEALETRKERVDIAAWFGFFTFDFMGDMAFGGGFDLMRDGGDKVGVWRIIKQAVPTFLTHGHVPWAATLLYNCTFLDGNFKTLRRFAATQAKRRMREGSMAPDLFHYSYELDGALEQYSFSRITSESVTAILAGSDTTSTALSNIVFFMCQQPEYLHRLRDEVNKAFPDLAEPFDAVKLSRMPLLNGIINEALRLQPPVLSGVQRSVIRGSGAKVIGSRIFPEETNVFVHTYSVHRDPRYFHPLPDSFWPDRWLAEADRQYPTALFGAPSPPEKVTGVDKFVLNSTAFIPFSFGPAACVGKNLAMQEMRMIVALLAQKFDICFAEGKGEGWQSEEWLAGQEDWFIAKIDRLLVQLTPHF